MTSRLSFVEHFGRNRCLFFTITDEGNLHPTQFARRWNSFLVRNGKWIVSYIRVLEPQKQGRPHYHLLVAVNWNTRAETFDWEAFDGCQEERRKNGPTPRFRELRARYKSSAAPELVALWSVLHRPGRDPDEPRNSTVCFTAQSFITWRSHSSLRPKTLNDLLGAMTSLLNWMERQQLILSNPLKHVERVHDRSPREFRRALYPEDAQRLLTVAPPHRATVYLMILYTGLRKCELMGLKWEHFDFEANPPSVRVPASISKNGKTSTHGLRPELVSALKSFRPVNAMPFEWAFRGIVPRVPTFKKDLAAAKIPFEDEKGRRMDLHSLRKSFGTMLAVSGVSLRVGMELMRHSESRLTEKVYTDASHLPLQSALASLPSLSVQINDAPPDAPAGDFSGHFESRPVASSHFAPISQVSMHGTLGHKKAPCVTTRRLSEMERAKRLELSTSTLARWCSTN